jgi:hypothetical protein
MTPMWFALLSFAVYRVVRLWLYDTIAAPLRAAVTISDDGDPGFLMRHPNRVTMWALDLLSCQWCLGVWVSFGAVAVLALAGMPPYDATPLGVALAVVTALALSAAQSAVHLVEDLLLGDE